MKKNLKNKKGFTLIELIVVIGILAVLAMILVPMVSGYMDTAKTQVANANARGCYSAAGAVNTMVHSGIIKDDTSLATNAGNEMKNLGYDGATISTSSVDPAEGKCTIVGTWGGTITSASFKTNGKVGTYNPAS